MIPLHARQQKLLSPQHVLLPLVPTVPALESAAKNEESEEGEEGEEGEGGEGKHAEEGAAMTEPPQSPVRTQAVCSPTWQPRTLLQPTPPCAPSRISTASPTAPPTHRSAASPAPRSWAVSPRAAASSPRASALSAAAARRASAAFASSPAASSSTSSSATPRSLPVVDEVEAAELAMDEQAMERSERRRLVHLANSADDASSAAAGGASDEKDDDDKEEPPPSARLSPEAIRFPSFDPPSLSSARLSSALLIWPSMVSTTIASPHQSLGYAHPPPHSPPPRSPLSDSPPPRSPPPRSPPPRSPPPRSPLVVVTPSVAAADDNEEREEEEQREILPDFPPADTAWHSDGLARQNDESGPKSCDHALGAAAPAASLESVPSSALRAQPFHPYARGRDGGGGARGTGSGTGRGTPRRGQGSGRSRGQVAAAQLYHPAGWTTVLSAGTVGRGVLGRVASYASSSSGAPSDFPAHRSDTQAAGQPPLGLADIAPPPSLKESDLERTQWRQQRPATEKGALRGDGSGGGVGNGLGGDENVPWQAGSSARAPHGAPVALQRVALYK